MSNHVKEDHVAHEFLSDDWFSAVEALGPPPLVSGADTGAINIVVTRVDDADVEVHLSDGRLTRGLVDDPSMTLRTTYEVAKAVFLKGDQHAAMQAFISGQVKVQGDMATLMAIGRAAPTPEERTYAKSILGLTKS